MSNSGPDRRSNPGSGIRILIAAAVFLLSLVAASGAGAAGYRAADADMVVVYKAARVMYLLRDGERFRTYRIALGSRPRGDKIKEGDSRTPEGPYVIDWRNPDSDFHLSLHISYPTALDVAEADALGVAPGGDIMIHGLPNGQDAAAVGHPFTDWTGGCIAVTNEEIEEIWGLVADGTPIFIFP